MLLAALYPKALNFRLPNVHLPLEPTAIHSLRTAVYKSALVFSCSAKSKPSQWSAGTTKQL